MDFGDIYLVEIPGSGGHEQQGIRPAIIVQTSENIEKVPTVLVVPFTTQIKASNFPFTPLEIMPRCSLWARGCSRVLGYVSE
jgi:mRNA-degrading endonuclease toxin of MazEF toxin-antitoxin module